MQSEPTVSVIISAYNRPQIVPFAIKSVIASDFEDWELIVVGDGCNAQTEEAVRAFSDPRIRFFNLPANTGHQSAPHNKGVEIARGEYVFFLNQDDMYFADHMSRRLAFMRQTGADISWSPILLLQQSGLETGPIDIEQDRLTLDGAVAGRRFDPESFVISSCWAVRREICDAVGPWLPPDKTRLSPSQEWLYRADRQGRSMAYHPYVSVLCIHSGVRRYSYLNPESFEHKRAWDWLVGGPAERLNLMHCVAVQQAGELVGMRKAWLRVTRPFRSSIERVLNKRGIHPHSLQRFLQGLKKGEWVGDHTRFTTKPPSLPLNERTAIGRNAADVYLGRGWHPGEGEGRWSGAATADIYFSKAEEAGPRVLEICGHALREDDEVTFKVNDCASVTHAFGSTDKVITLELPDGAEVYHVTISVKRPSSPLKIGLSSDSRTLAYWLTWLRLASRNAAD